MCPSAVKQQTMPIMNSHKCTWLERLSMSKTQSLMDDLTLSSVAAQFQRMLTYSKITEGQYTIKTEML